MATKGKKHRASHKASIEFRTQRDRRRLRLWLIPIVVGVLLVDQALKFWVKTTFYLGQEVSLIGDWALLHFTENKGIAFGISPDSETGKLFLSLFRIVMTGLLGYVIFYLSKLRNVPRGVVIGVMFIFAGALGNIIDGTFYGLLFSSSEGYTMLADGTMAPVVAEFLPEGGGYAPLFHGLVVDMLYFPIIDTTWPEWLPGIGGRPFRFFEPVFNIADSAITGAVFYLFIFQWRFLLGKNHAK